MITSSSTRTYRVNLPDASTDTRTYQWRQTITFQSCQHGESLRDMKPTQLLSVEQVFALYDANEIIRFAMTNKIGDVNGEVIESSCLPVWATITSFLEYNILYNILTWVSFTRAICPQQIHWHTVKCKGRLFQWVFDQPDAFIHTDLPTNYGISLPVISCQHQCHEKGYFCSFSQKFTNEFESPLITDVIRELWRSLMACGKRLLAILVGLALMI